MSQYSEYYDKWIMREVVPYLLKTHFRNMPTSNKDLSEAFWKLMGKNVEIGGKRRWTTGKRGVPYHIDRLTKKHILAEVPTNTTTIGQKNILNINIFINWGLKGKKKLNRLRPNIRKNLSIKKLRNTLAKTHAKKLHH